MRLSAIIEAMRATASGGAAGYDGEPSGYTIDSRAVAAGDLFFAIRGETHDGHRFTGEALNKGAVAAVVARDFFDSNESQTLREANAPLLVVEDTLAALQSLASSVVANWRGRLIAITGSMGKTTTKEMVAAVLGVAGRVAKTVGNLNNAYGLPLSILKMESAGAHASDFDFGVFEMGMNHAGEIRELARIAPPDVAVVTNVAPVHLEFFDSIDAIAEAKAELVDGVKANGAAVLNANDPRVASMRERRSDLTIVTFGIAQPADVMARNVEAEGVTGARFELATPAGTAMVEMEIAGRHNVSNALAAAAVGALSGLEPARIAAALGEVKSPRMRGEVIRFPQGFAIVDDSYNSNPRALLEVAAALAATRGYRRKIVVAGEMLELGASGVTLHREAGRRLAGLDLDLLIGVRGLALDLIAGARDAGMSEDAARFCATTEEAAEALAGELRAGDLVLVKGSRGVRTEAVVQEIKRRFGMAPENGAQNH